MIEFRQTNEFERGIIYKLLCESYAELLKAKPDHAEKYRANRKKADHDTFDYPDSIGRSVLISTPNDEPIGFISWDPRRTPEEGALVDVPIVALLSFIVRHQILKLEE